MIWTHGRCRIEPVSQGPLDYAVPSPRGGIIPSRIVRWVRRVWPYLALLILCYVGSYVFLSAFGRFQLFTIGAGANGIRVRSYIWSRAGFHKGYRQRWALYYIYLPLHIADRFYWH